MENMEINNNENIENKKINWWLVGRIAFAAVAIAGGVALLIKGKKAKKAKKTQPQQLEEKK